MTDLLLRSVRPWPREPGSAPVDVLIRAGQIAAIGPDLDAEVAGSDVPSADGHGGVLLPAFADVHAHLDSTRLGLPFRGHSAGPGLTGLIENDRANWRSDGDVATRATRTLAATIASGTTVVRSHAQIDTDARLERLEGVLAAGEAHAMRCHLQVVAFPQSGIVRDRGTAELLDAAIGAGADLIGGIDPCGLDRDPVEHLDIVFGLADRHQVGIDIHLHESGELGAFTFELIGERTAALAMQGKVTISHAFGLSSVDAARQVQLIDMLAKNDIALTTVAPGTTEPLPIADLRAAGVRVGLARTASATSGRPTATATCWSGRGSWPSSPASAATSSSKHASMSLREEDGPSFTEGHGRRRACSTMLASVWPSARPPTSSWSGPTRSPPR